MYIYFLLLIVIIIIFSIKRGSDELIAFEPHYSRLLPTKMEQYYDRPAKEMLSIKLGQRKLLFNEIEFYTVHAQPGDIIVYAGAAAGHHEIAILNLFPDCQFEFYDTNPFEETLVNYKNCKMYHQYFTDEDATKYTGKNILFLSDIRTCSKESCVAVDMEMQRRWCEIIKPRMAMLKFRLQWSPGELEYFDGEIYTQPRNGHVSSEMRLWTDCKKMKIWNNDEYNNRVFYYQKYNRNAYHDFELLKEIPGMDHCHDCWSEIEIWKNFIKRFGGDLVDLMKKSSLACHQGINIPPHGMMPDEKDINKKIEKLKTITEPAFKKAIEHQAKKRDY